MVIINVVSYGLCTTHSFPSWLLYIPWWCFYTNTSDRMLDIPFGFYYPGFEYPGRSLTLLVYVTPASKWTHRYYPLGESMMFDRYLLLMKELNVDWLLRSHKFSSLLASAAASSRMVYPTHIMSVLHLLYDNTSWDFSVIVSIWNTSCDEVWQNMSPRDGRSSYYLVGMPIMRLHYESSKSTNVFCSTPPSIGLLPYFRCFVFLNASVSYFRSGCMEHSLFPA